MLCKLSLQSLATALAVHYGTWSDQWVSLATLLSNKSTLQAAETNASAYPCLKQTSVLESLSIAHSSIFLSICGTVYWGKEDCVTVQAEQLGVGVKNPYSATSYSTNHLDIYTAITICNCRTDVPDLLPWLFTAQTGRWDKLQPSMWENISDVYKLTNWGQAKWRNCPTANN